MKPLPDSQCRPCLCLQGGKFRSGLGPQHRATTPYCLRLSASYSSVLSVTEAQMGLGFLFCGMR